MGQQIGTSAVLLAVQMANSICMESKKKNITRSETDAPNGRHNACIVSKVCTSRIEKSNKVSVRLSKAGRCKHSLVSLAHPSLEQFSFSFSFASCSIFKDLSKNAKELYCVCNEDQSERTYLKLPYTMRSIGMRKVDTRDESIKEYILWHGAEWYTERIVSIEETYHWLALTSTCVGTRDIALALQIRCVCFDLNCTAVSSSCALVCTTVTRPGTVSSYRAENVTRLWIARCLDWWTAMEESCPAVSASGRMQKPKCSRSRHRLAHTSASECHQYHLHKHFIIEIG